MAQNTCSSCRQPRMLHPESWGKDCRMSEASTPEESETGEEFNSKVMEAALNEATPVTSRVVNKDTLATPGLKEASTDCRDAETESHTLDSSESTDTMRFEVEKKQKSNTFEELAEEAGLKEATIAKLLKEEYDSIQAVATITEAELEILGLSLAQKGMLNAWVGRLRTTPSSRATTPGGELQEAGREGISTSQATSQTITKGEAISSEGQCQAPASLPVTEDKTLSSESPPQAPASSHVTEDKTLSSESPQQASASLHVIEDKTLSSVSPPQAPACFKGEVMSSTTEHKTEHRKFKIGATKKKKTKAQRLKDEDVQRFKSNYEKFLKKLELNPNHPISLQLVMEVRKPPDKLRLPHLPLRLVSLLMSLDNRARDHFLSEMGKSEDKDNSFTFDYSDDGIQSHDLPPNPMDVFLATFHCCDKLLQQILARNMFLCKLAIPLLYPIGTSENLVFSLWALRAIIVQCSGGSKPSKEVSVTDHPFPIVTFVRLGSPSISKSNLLNHVLTEGKLQTFYSSECQRRSQRRGIGDGVVECSWFLPAFEDADLFQSVVAFFNLRGDATEHQKQMSLVNEVSSVIVAIANVEDIAKERHSTTFKNISSSNKQVIQVLTSHSRSPDPKMVQKELTALTDLVGKKRLQGIKQILTFRLNTKSNELNIRLQELLPKLIEKSCQISLEKIAELSKNFEFQVDEHDPACSEGKRQAMKLLKELEGKEVKTYKRDLLPAQGEIWTKFTERQKKLHRVGETEGSNALKDELLHLRCKQAQLCKKLTPFMRSFVNSLLLTEKSTQRFFLQWMKLLLDSTSRKHLPGLHRKYFDVWKSLHKETTKESREKIDKAEKNITDASFGLEHIFRELGQIYEAVKDSNTSLQDPLANIISKLPKAVAELLLTGIPLELVDGDTSSVPITWVKAVLSELNAMITGDKKKMFVISVLGVQSSGKSTLLNTMFGLQFAVSAGRCTRGAFMQLIKVTRPDLPVGYIAVIDTEGLRAPELAQLKYHHDNELATFAIGLGDITLINIKGENTAEIKDALQITVHAFIRMKVVNKKMNIKRSCIFIHQNVPAVNAKEKMMQSCQKLHDQLDQMTKEAARSEKNVGYKLFSEIIQFDINEHVFYFVDFWQGDPPMAPVNLGYSKKAVSVKHFLEKSMIKHTNFITVPDLAQRIEDLRKGILGENFVFSFRNSLELKVYNSLEEEYSKIKWSLESAITEWIIEEAGTKLRRCDTLMDLGRAYESLVRMLKEFKTAQAAKSEEQLNEFFEQCEDQDIMIQWQQTTLSNMGMEAETFLYRGIIQLEVIRKEVEVRLVTTESLKSSKAEAMISASELADSLRGKQASANQLEDSFNRMWSPIQKALLSRNEAEALNVKEEIHRALDDLFKHFPQLLYDEHKNRKADISQPLKLSPLGKNLSLKEIEVDSHFDFKEAGQRSPSATVGQPGILSKLSGFFSPKRTTGPQRGPTCQQYEDACKQKLLYAAQTILNATEADLSELARSGVNFQTKHVTDALRSVQEGVEKFNQKEGPKEPALQANDNFTAQLAVLVSRKCHTVFNEMQSNYKKKYGIEAKVREIREEAWLDFKHKVGKLAEVDAAAELFCHQLKPIVESKLEDAIPNIVVKEVMGHFSRKYHLMLSILDGLCGKEDFEAYTEYLRDSKAFALKWVVQHIDREFFTRSTRGMSRYGELMERQIDLIMKEVDKSIKDATKSAKSDKSLDKWISTFCKIGKIPVPPSVFEMFRKKDIQDFPRLENKLKEDCAALKTLLIIHYNQQTPEEIEWKGGSPYQKVINKLWGCPAQCPFCGEPCSFSVHGSEKEHNCLQHRPQGTYGTRWVWSNELVADTCNYLVQSSSRFSCGFHKAGHDDCSLAGEDKDDRYHPYKEYKTFFSEWDIAPDPENTASEYWAWFTAKYRDQLADHYKAKAPCIPEKWKHITKGQALKDLRKYR